MKIWWCLRSYLCRNLEISQTFEHHCIRIITCLSFRCLIYTFSSFRFFLLFFIVSSNSSPFFFFLLFSSSLFFCFFLFLFFFFFPLLSLFWLFLLYFLSFIYFLFLPSSFFNSFFFITIFYLFLYFLFFLLITFVINFFLNFLFFLFNSSSPPPHYHWCIGAGWSEAGCSDAAGISDVLHTAAAQRWHTQEETEHSPLQGRP